MRWRYHKKQHFRFPKILLSILCILFYLIYIFFERQISDGINNIVILKAEELCTNAVNTAVIDTLCEDNYQYGDFAEINNNGKTVTNISINSVNSNKFKAKVSLKSQENIKEMSGMSINYNIGDFLYSQLFGARGFDVTVKLSFSASVTTDIESTFTECGINQTKHTLSVKVCAKVYITSDKDFETYKTVITTVPIAENIIIGEIPSFYREITHSE